MTNRKDPYWGKGGRYVVVDGKRVPAAAVPPAPTSAPAPEPAPAPKKGK